MPVKGTVAIQLTQEQAAATACWLLEDYQPDPTQLLVPSDWCAEQKSIALGLGTALAKAAARKRAGPRFALRLTRAQAQWLATFQQKGWWEFDDGIQMPGQPAPESIQAIAVLALRAVNRRKGRPLMTLLDTLDSLDRSVKAEADPRVRRRVRNETKPAREWEKKEADAAGPEPKD